MKLKILPESLETIPYRSQRNRRDRGVEGHIHSVFGSFNYNLRRRRGCKERVWERLQGTGVEATREKWRMAKMQGEKTKTQRIGSNIHFK